MEQQLHLEFGLLEQNVAYVQKLAVLCCACCMRLSPSSSPGSVPSFTYPSTSRTCLFGCGPGAAGGVDVSPARTVDPLSYHQNLAVCNISQRIFHCRPTHAIAVVRASRLSPSRTSLCPADRMQADAVAAPVPKLDLCLKLYSTLVISVDHP